MRKRWYHEVHGLITWLDGTKDALPIRNGGEYWFRTTAVLEAVRKDAIEIHGITYRTDVKRVRKDTPLPGSRF